MNQPPILSLPARIEGEIELQPAPALNRLRRDLIARLTFENEAWKKKLTRGHPTQGTPRNRHAFRRMEDGSLRIARGAWKILLELAKEYRIELQWDPKVLSTNERPAQFQLKAELRPYQQNAIQAAINSRGGVIVIPTGGGKTVVALGLAAALQTETLFIVHTRELLRQTQQSAARFLGIEAGIIGAGKWEPASFTVALIQTLARRDLEEIRNKFGLIIVDEAHHAPAQSYFDVLPQFPARHRVALTATPFRKDGLHHLLWLQFGEIVYRIHKSDLEEHGRLLTPTFYPVKTEFSYDYSDDFPAMITSLTQNVRRHRLLIDTISETHRPGGCSLVLTERVDHCKKLTASLQKANLPAVMLHGQLSPKVRMDTLEKLQSGEAELLIATLSLIGEGWDHPPLDTLYLTVPNGNSTKTTQALGRILRPHPNKPTPRVYDFIDINVSLLRHHWGIRSRAYGLSQEEMQSALWKPRPKATVENVPPKIEYLDMIRAVSRGDFNKAENILTSSHPKKN